MLSESCSECQFDSCPGEPEMSYRAFLFLDLVKLELLSTGISSVADDQCSRSCILEVNVAFGV